MAFDIGTFIWDAVGKVAGGDMLGKDLAAPRTENRALAQAMASTGAAPVFNPAMTTPQTAARQRQATADMELLALINSMMEQSKDMFARSQAGNQPTQSAQGVKSAPVTKTKGSK